MMRKIITLLAIISASNFVHANTDSLRNKIIAYCNNYQATVGVSIIFIENSDTMNINGNKMFPMLSVYKLPITMCVLNNVDNRLQTLQTPIHITTKDMHKNTWSPLRDALTNSDTSLCLAEIIKHTLIQSDNNCTDLLLKTIGGVKTVQAYLKQIGLPNIEVNNTEWEMFQSPNLIYSNKATPSDITSLLNKLYNQKLFSDSCFNFLWKTLSDCSTGNNRIRGRLPKETEVAHKTGTSFTTKDGITPAINDVGIITLPNGKHIALAIFVSESKENRETNERIIAEITEIIWEYATRH